MVMRPITLSASDVAIRDYVRMCSDCEAEQATAYVEIDFRNNGSTINASGPLCQTCADAFASRLRASLYRTATMTNDERFEQWYAETLAWRPMAFTEHSKNDLRLGFVGGGESERARVREIADRIEALPSYRMEVDDDGPYMASSKDGFYVNTEELFELLKELRSE